MFNLKSTAHNEYYATVKRKAGTPDEYEERVGPFRNILLDRFFDRWIAGQTTYGGFIQVGTGTTPVDPEQTSLENRVAVYPTGAGSSHVVTTMPNFLDGGVYYMHMRVIDTFGLGQVVGNLAEFGLEFSGSPNPTGCDSRARTLDPQGNPAVIVVTEEDQFIAEYNLYMSIPVTPVVDERTILGVTTTVTLETLNALTITGGVGWSINRFLSGGSNFASNQSRLSTSQELVNNPEATSGSGTASEVDTQVFNSQGATRVARCTVGRQAGNFVAGLKYITIGGQNTAFLGMHFSPPVIKTDEMTFRYETVWSLSNVPEV